MYCGRLCYGFFPVILKHHSKCSQNKNKSFLWILGHHTSKFWCNGTAKMTLESLLNVNIMRHRTCFNNFLWTLRNGIFSDILKHHTKSSQNKNKSFLWILGQHTLKSWCNGTARTTLESLLNVDIMRHRICFNYVLWTFMLRFFSWYSKTPQQK